MKALVLLTLLPAFMLIGCGKMQTNKDSAGNVLQEMTNNNAISEEDANSVDESLLDTEIEVSQSVDQPNSVMMKLGGAELLIDFIEDLSGDPEETAMVINGVEVPAGLAADKNSFQGLIASLVTSQLEGVDILGIPVGQLVQAGLGLISGDTDRASFSNLFGTLIRGALNMFLDGTPFGNIFGSLVDGLLGDDNSGNSSQGNNNNGNNNSNNNGNTNNNNGNNNNNNSGGGLGGIVNTIGGVLTGGNPLLGGIFSLITNLFN